MRPLTAKIDLDALRGNLALVRQRVGATRIWAIVKADAYGHGLARVQVALDGADGLALLELDAAIAARERGWSKPMLLLEGYFQAAEIDLVSRYDITPVIHHSEQIAMLEAARLEKPMDVVLKINSGMNRLGLRAAQSRAALQRLRALDKVSAITLMTHYADA
ncbi:MAG: alanine racemase, partial [Burkholderiales bacterium]